MLKMVGDSKLSVEKIRLENLHSMFSGTPEEFETDDARKLRLRRIGRLKEAYRAELALLEMEELALFSELTKVAPKPTLVKAAVRSSESVQCHICGKMTTNKVNGRFECRDHSAVSRMSELERRVLNDFMTDIKNG